MSSVLQVDSPNLPITKFVPIRSMCYYDVSLNHDVLIPFTYNDGVLDIKIQDGTSNLIETGNYYDNNGWNWRMVKMMGGDGLVTSLGSNFSVWLSNYVYYESEEIDSYFTLVTNPVMTRVQQVVQQGQYAGCNASGHGPLNSQYAIRFSTEPPTSDDYIIAGDSNNSFFAAWVFKTPITVSYIYNGSNRYVTLTTQFQNPNYY